MEISRIKELKFQGYCCSQIIMQMGLEGTGRENDDLIAAMAGLCDGMHRGKVCGTLSSAICLLYLVAGNQAGRLCDELYEWFEDSYGSVECDTILKGNPINKAAICGDLVESTYLKLVEMFEDNNIDFQSEQ
ncbi:MAG: C_GCAxxG_C_C family protein [Clostridiales bacterium]|jgi:hypothetical protein|nr:C_GCAxxG_C_C family protein [Clostridiales bacterium]